MATPLGRTSGLDRVVVINDVSVVRGGATKVALTSARMLSERGVPVTLLVGDHGDPGALPESPDVRIEGAGGSHILHGGRVASFRNGIFNDAARRHVASWIERNDTPGTLYHLHGWSKILSPSVFAALRPVSSRLIVAAHDFFLACPNGAYFDFRVGEVCSRKPLSGSCLTTNCDRRSYAQKLWRCARQVSVRATHDLPNSEALVLAVHEGMHPHLVRGGIGPQRLRTLRNPVEPWSADRIASERNDVFVYVGRLEEDKGVRLLANAASRAGVRLRLIGAGPLGAEIARDHPEVEQIGWRTGAELTAAVADARALVMPSRYREPFGIVALEAAMSGLPVVLSDYALLAPEMVAGGFALSCDPHDEEGLAATLIRVATDGGLVESMSRSGHAAARSLAPSPDQWIDGLLAVYRQRLAAAEEQAFWRATAAALLPAIVGGASETH